MPISTVSKAQPMREGEIAAIDALNEAITQINNLDVSGLSTRLQTIETNITNLTTRMDAVDGVNGSVATLAARVSTAETDIDNIEATLYTNLSQSV